MYRHQSSLLHRGNRFEWGATAVSVTMHHSPLHLLAIAKLCWVYMLAGAAVTLALGNGFAHGAEEDEGPDMAAYYEAASPAPGPRVAPVVYGDNVNGDRANGDDANGDATVGSGLSLRSAGELDGARYSPDAEGSLAYEHELYPEASVGEARIVAGRNWFSSMTDGFGDEFGDGLGGDFRNTACQCGECNGYHWEFLPKESLYPFYLADPKASRMAGQWIEATDDGTLLDGTLGGRFGLFRYVDATPGPFKRGIQADIEGSAQVRLDMDREHDVRSVDFRAGVPIAVSFGRFQTRFGYYHLSSHVGDEFLIRLPAFDRLNYSRDVLFLGGAYWLNESTRVYGEAGWAFYYDVCEPWEFTFGIESAPRRATGLRGAPFYAINSRLQEEVDYGGSLTAQVGWAWRSAYNTGLLRTGLHYFNGKSNQFSFFDDHEELIGAGLWYDF